MTKTLSLLAELEALTSSDELETWVDDLVYLMGEHSMDAWIDAGHEEGTGWPG